MTFRPPLIDLDPADSAHLEWARRLAHQGWGQVHPNPMVGCVLVNDAKVVGEGWHEVFGGPHAEIVALERALSRAEGATAYVSLEPCNHHGKTPPCSQALVDAGVKRVVFGARDPGASSGGGAETLRAAGVEVVGPVWDEGTARAENPAFFHAARHDRPFLALKLAMSLDSRIAAAPGERTRITGSEAEQEVHRIRTGFDAVMVGQGTVVADDPRLTPRLVPPGREPIRRILLLPEADLHDDAAVLEEIERHPVHVFCLDTTPEAALERLEAIVHELEEEQLGLTESLQRYEDGVRYFKHCHEALQEAERRIEMLTGVDADDQPLTEPYAEEAMTLEEKQQARSQRRSRQRRPAPESAPEDDVDTQRGLF